MKTKKCNEYKVWKAVMRSCNVIDLLTLMDERLSKMIHHRNQLKHFQDTKWLVLDNVDAVEIEMDYSENLDKPLT